MTKKKLDQCVTIIPVRTHGTVPVYHSTLLLNDYDYSTIMTHYCSFQEMDGTSMARSKWMLNCCGSLSNFAKTMGTIMVGSIVHMHLAVDNTSNLVCDCNKVLI